MKKTTIVYATDHNFVFIAAVSLYSLIFNYKDEDLLEIHILIDQTVTETDKEYFAKIEKDFSNISIKYHLITVEMLETMDFSHTYLNKMTLYRLMLPELLSDVDTCIYLDADTLVRGDISNLAKTDMNGYYLAGVWDMGMESFPYTLEELPDMESYINAGVLVINLGFMREMNLQQALITKIPQKYRFSDQDILNICCYGHIRLLPEKYNYFSYRDEFNFHTVISHFLTWIGLRPWRYIKAKHADEWWKYASYFEDTDLYKQTRAIAEREYNGGSLKYILTEWKNYKKIYIWGTTGFSYEFFNSMQMNGANMNKFLGFVDGNKEKQAILFCGCTVHAPESIELDEDTLVICTARQEKSIGEIKNDLLARGCKETQIIVYRQRETGFYTHMDPIYLQEEMQEAHYWKYGKVTKLI